MKPVPPCRPPSPRRNCGGYPPLSPLILPISPINMGTVIHLNPHWSSLSPDVVKRFNYDVPLPAGVGCSYIINSSSTLDGMCLPPIVLCRAERASISTVTADQQVAAGPESVLHEGSSRGPKGDTKTLLSKGNRSSVPEPMHTGSNSWTQASFPHPQVSFLWRRPCSKEFRRCGERYGPSCQDWDQGYPHLGVP